MTDEAIRHNATMRPLSFRKRAERLEEQNRALKARLARLDKLGLVEAHRRLEAAEASLDTALRERDRWREIADDNRAGWVAAEAERVGLKAENAALIEAGQGVYKRARVTYPADHPDLAAWNDLIEGKGK